MITRAVLLSFVAAGTIAVSAAMACSCVRYDSAADQLRHTDVMFVGRVDTTTRVFEHGRFTAITSFTVERTLKGERSRIRRIHHSQETGGMCGVQFQRGRTYTVMASSLGGRLTTGSCSSPQFPLEDYERALAAR